MIKERFISYVEDSIRKNWEKEALSNYREKGYTYREIAAIMVKQHMAFREYGIREGDTIALLGRNSANWCATYLAVVTYGAVVVPILPDFKPDDLHNIINHSDSKILFADDKLWESLEPEKVKDLQCVMSLDSFEMLLSRSGKITEIYKSLDDKFSQAYPAFSPADIKFSGIDNEKLAVLSYTSGTTGFSKGVMIPHRSLAANIRYAQKNMPLEPGDKVVSFLPLAHTYGCAFEFLFPFTYGCHITILTKTPSPQILIQAFKEIRPRLILSVPLVIEKVYKKQLLPVISKPAMKVMLKVPGINKILFKKVREKLETSFGGNFKELVIGGAAFNADAEKFFRKIGMRYAVGYGMTECGPLISYDGWRTARLASCGKPVDTLEVKIDSPDPQNVVGEIILRGDNVMLGYYKNEKATKEVIDEDGWMHTGDLGVIDKDGYIYIRGRSKDMLLGPSGKNIYPEEIESVINNYKYVTEAVVISEEDKLVGLIYPDYEALRNDGIGEDGLAAALDTIRKDVNSRLPDYMAVTKFRVHPEEFAKTPKKSIKRYLYMKG
ncbi:MAG: AMP-binding protein [Bacteroidales bacterium]|jgi:long-chain acyl-CoA synthetase|nr:AMP-binding protein [Bacteroidales bacterium]MDX9927654.1 AMP-binding protein [Bacteroidales bacterium]HNX84393.1 AMP-binding protein [Bacteroidales bacterium]HOC03900.1 AMP-binding protein [Bacteroidales bacterium]